MKAVVLCGVAVLICCGCRDAGSPRAVQKRREKVGGMMKGLSRQGDELYFFTSEPQSWAELAGIDGYVLVRKDEIVDMMVRRIN